MTVFPVRSTRAALSGGVTALLGPTAPMRPFSTTKAPLSMTVPSPMINRPRSEEHTSELQSHHDLVCRLLLEKKKKKKKKTQNNNEKNKEQKQATQHGQNATTKPCELILET